MEIIKIHDVSESALKGYIGASVILVYDGKVTFQEFEKIIHHIEKNGLKFIFSDFNDQVLKEKYLKLKCQNLFLKADVSQKKDLKNCEKEIDPDKIIYKKVDEVLYLKLEDLFLNDFFSQEENKIYLYKKSDSRYEACSEAKQVYLKTNNLEEYCQLNSFNQIAEEYLQKYLIIFNWANHILVGKKKIKLKGEIDFFSGFIDIVKHSSLSPQFIPNKINFFNFTDAIVIIDKANFLFNHYRFPNNTVFKVDLAIKKKRIKSHHKAEESFLKVKKICNNIFVAAEGFDKKPNIYNEELDSINTKQECEFKKKDFLFFIKNFYKLISRFNLIIRFDRHDIVAVQANDKKNQIIFADGNFILNENDVILMQKWQDIARLRQFEFCYAPNALGVQNDNSKPTAKFAVKVKFTHKIFWDFVRLNIAHKANLYISVNKVIKNEFYFDLIASRDNKTQVMFSRASNLQFSFADIEKLKKYKTQSRWEDGANFVVKVDSLQAIHNYVLKGFDYKITGATKKKYKISCVYNGNNSFKLSLQNITLDQNDFIMLAADALKDKFTFANEVKVNCEIDKFPGLIMLFSRRYKYVLQNNKNKFLYGKYYLITVGRINDNKKKFILDDVYLTLDEVVPLLLGNISENKSELEGNFIIPVSFVEQNDTFPYPKGMKNIVETLPCGYEYGIQEGRSLKYIYQTLDIHIVRMMAKKAKAIMFDNINLYLHEIAYLKNAKIHPRVTKGFSGRDIVDNLLLLNNVEYEFGSNVLFVMPNAKALQDNHKTSLLSHKKEKNIILQNKILTKEDVDLFLNNPGIECDFSGCVLQKNIIFDGKNNRTTHENEIARIQFLIDKGVNCAYAKFENLNLTSIRNIEKLSTPEKINMKNVRLTSKQEKALAENLYCVVDQLRCFPKNALEGFSLRWFKNRLDKLPTDMQFKYMRIVTQIAKNYVKNNNKSTLRKHFRRILQKEHRQANVQMWEDAVNFLFAGILGIGGLCWFKLANSLVRGFCCCFRGKKPKPFNLGETIKNTFFSGWTNKLALGSMSVLCEALPSAKKGGVRKSPGTPDYSAHKPFFSLTKNNGANSKDDKVVRKLF